MSIVYLNGEFLPMSEAKISPMDRGFLFGDGIYEVIPSYEGKLVGFEPHLDRLQRGLKALDLNLLVDRKVWRDVSNELIMRNKAGNLGLYFQVSRGADSTRHHAYPVGIKPTVFGFCFNIPPALKADKAKAPAYHVSTARDLRWKRCDIKTTAILGNVMHYQNALNRGHQETILYNSKKEVTEASACNVFVVKNGIVSTPQLDEQKLPGITRFMLLDMLKKDGSLQVEEREITLEELKRADEVWISSSSKEVAPVVEVDGEPVGDGKVGDIWEKAQSLYEKHKFDY